MIFTFLMLRGRGAGLKGIWGPWVSYMHGVRAIAPGFTFEFNGVSDKMIERDGKGYHFSYTRWDRQLESNY